MPMPGCKHLGRSDASATGWHTRRANRDVKIRQAMEILDSLTQSNSLIDYLAETLAEAHSLPDLLAYLLSETRQRHREDRARGY